MMQFAFCPTGPGGGVDPTCSPANAGTGGGYQYQHVAVLRVNQWPEDKRRQLRALQSRLSRATTEEAKAVVRAQIEQLRNRVNAVHDALRSPGNQPAALAQAAAANAAINQATKAAAVQVKQLEAAKQLAMMETPAEYKHVASIAQARINELLADPERGSYAREVMEAFYPDTSPDKYGEVLMKSTGFDDVAAKALGPGTNPYIRFNASKTIYSYGAYIGINISKDGATLSRTLNLRENGELRVKNDLFTLPKSKQKDGIGVRIFSQQVAGLGDSKAAFIETQAAKGGGYVGYKVWPKFGYDTDTLGSSVDVHATPPGIVKAAHTRDDGRWIGTMQATIATKEGAKWWADNGDSVYLKFYLDDKAYVSQSVLRAYRERKLAELKQAAAVELAFCPTGLGGGVDPTCSPANAGHGSGAVNDDLLPSLKKATGSKNWPDVAKKKLRALQSRLSRAKTAEAKALVILAINALIDEQSGKSPAPTATPTQHDQAQTVVDAKVAASLLNQGSAVKSFLAMPSKAKYAIAANYYLGAGYGGLNNGLRTNAGDVTKLSQGNKDTVAALDELLTSFGGAPQNLVTTRAVGNATQQAWQPGYVHTEHGYLSMSATAIRSGNSSWDRVNRCIITVPKGTRGAYMGVHSPHKSEREFLGGRGLKLRVTHRRNNVPKAEAAKVLFANRENGVSALNKASYNLIYMTVEAE